MLNILPLGPSPIRELDGLFSLNDLHRASGGAPKHAPRLFLRSEQIKALVREIQGTDLHLALKVTHGGSNPGTYACRELVIAYAAWISPTFHLKVLRVFLDQTKNSVPAERKEAAQIVASAVASKVFSSAYNAIVNSGGKHWQQARWLVSLSDDDEGVRPSTRLIENDEFVMSLGHLTREIYEPEDRFGTSEELAALADVCHKELIRRTAR